MRIADILTVKGSNVVTISGDQTVAAAVSTMARMSIGALVVSSDGRHVEGIVSERDVVRSIDGDPDALLGRPVSEIMSEPVHTTSPDAEVEELMVVMTERRIRHVPVVHDGVLTGLVSIGDVVKRTIDQLRLDRKLLEEYIAAR